MSCDLLNGIYGAGIERVVRIFRDKAAMRLHLGNAQLPGEVRHLEERIHTSFSRGWWHQADGGGAARKVPLERLGTNHLDSGGSDAVFREQIAKLGSDGRGEAVDIPVERQKAIREAKVAYAAEVFFRSSEGSDEQAEFHRLELCRRRQHGSRCGCSDKECSAANT